LAGVRARGASKKIGTPVFIFVAIEASKFKFAIQLGLGQQLTKKQLLGPKLAGVWARKIEKK